MPDSLEQQNIRGLDIDKTVKGFALVDYIFKNDCTVTEMSGDSVRWYQRTAGDLTVTSPSVLAGISPLSVFPTLEQSWTRNTSYIKKYGAECFISMEDIKSADIDVLAGMLRDLTRAVIKQVDTDIYNTMTENQSPSSINTTASTAAWDAASGQDPIKDILVAKQKIFESNYNADNGGYLYLSPKDHTSLLTWLISTKGSNIPTYSSARIGDGKIMNILNLDVRVSNNVAADSACVAVTSRAVTWKTHTDTTSRIIEEAGMGSKIRVWEIGVAILTDPKAVHLTTNTQT